MKEIIFASNVTNIINIVSQEHAICIQKKLYMFPTEQIFVFSIIALHGGHDFLPNKVDFATSNMRISTTYNKNRFAQCPPTNSHGNDTYSSMTLQQRPHATVGNPHCIQDYRSASENVK